jgi:hypothetical protein
MALNKKERRKIVVDDKEYFWIATGNDGWIDLCISSEIKGSPKLLTGFDYKYPVDDDINIAYQFVITPYIVRQVIEYALSQGWKPFEKGKDFALPVDDKIDLRLDKNTAISEKKSWLQFSLRMTTK